MPNSIFSPQVLASMRDNGYKSTASAIAELIDNSIEAGAKEINVITFEEVSKSKRKSVESIVIYDNGSGMSPKVMECALQFGGGTRHESVTGMGRFGMGLPNASVSACRRVNLYSWQNGKCFRAVLDIDEILDSGNLVLPQPVKCKIPNEILDQIDGGVGDSGTIVHWDNCDRLDFKKADTLFSRMEGDLCRIFRHFLDDCDAYGDKVTIKLIKPAHSTKGSKTDRVEKILTANDPLYILEPNNCPGYEGDRIADLQNDKPAVANFFSSKGEGEVEVRITAIKPEIHKRESGKTSDFMKHLADNQGISFVRLCREIQHGSFGYVNSYDPKERWWGVEVRFTPVLDELFGVTNNKQTVKGMNYMDQSSLDDLLGDYGMHESANKDYLNTSEGQALKLKIWLNQVIQSGLKKARDDIKSRNIGRRKADKNIEFDKASKAATEIIERKKAKSRFDEEANAKTEEQARKELKDRLQEYNKGIDEKELNELVDQVKDYRIHTELASWSGDQFFDIELCGNIPVVKLNTRHPFYESIYRDIEENHPEALNAFKVLIISYAWSESEFFGGTETKLLDRVRSKWGYYTSEILDQLQASK